MYYMEQLTDHNHVYDKLNYFHVSGKIPHLILYGYHGTGKKTILDWFINKIYNEDKPSIKKNVMSVNCAHGKGIKFIRDELKFFAKINIQSNNGSTFKSIILLNADYLTIDAQSALRRCIELFSHNTRFFIVIENKDKLLNPILSRFCEIYIPERFENNNIINLHSHFTNQTYNNNNNNNIDLSWISDKLETLSEYTITHNDLINVANELYEKGYSAIDLIDCVQRSSLFNKEEISRICMCFKIIKSEYRSENLLTLYILDYMYLRSNTDLKSVITI